MKMNKKDLPPLEKRQYDFEVRAEKSEGGAVICGRPIVYDSFTDVGGCFREVIEKGALDKADLSDVRFLVNHDLNRIPLARARKAIKNSTMELAVDDKGLSIKVTLDIENNADARALYSAVKRGDISGMSFMFGIANEEWEELDSDYPTRKIKEISSVVEVSAVTFPAYDASEIYARSQKAVETARQALENVRQTKNAGKPEGNLELEKLKAKYLYKI